MLTKFSQHLQSFTTDFERMQRLSSTKSTDHLDQSSQLPLHLSNVRSSSTNILSVSQRLQLSTRTDQSNKFEHKVSIPMSPYLNPPHPHPHGTQRNNPPSPHHRATPADQCECDACLSAPQNCSDLQFFHALKETKETEDVSQTKIELKIALEENNRLQVLVLENQDEIAILKRNLELSMQVNREMRNQLNDHEQNATQHSLQSAAECIEKWQQGLSKS